jgi:hypothetical protein
MVAEAYMGVKGGVACGALSGATSISDSPYISLTILSFSFSIRSR